jgi:hypothetical protein
MIASIERRTARRPGRAVRVSVRAGTRCSSPATIRRTGGPGPPCRGASRTPTIDPGPQETMTSRAGPQGRCQGIPRLVRRYGENNRSGTLRRGHPAKLYGLRVIYWQKGMPVWAALVAALAALRAANRGRGHAPLVRVFPQRFTQIGIRDGETPNGCHFDRSARQRAERRNLSRGRCPPWSLGSSRARGFSTPPTA